MQNMESYLASGEYDLVTPDGKIVSIVGEKAEIVIENISPAFVGFSIDPTLIFFNLKSTLAQIGLNAVTLSVELSAKTRSAKASLLLNPITPLATELLKLITPGAFIGKLFAADDRRRVRDPHYLLRMFGRCDRHGKPLLSLGGSYGTEKMSLEKTDGRTIAHLSLLEGAVTYDDSITGLIPTLALALHHPRIQTRSLLALHHIWHDGEKRTVKKGELLLVKTLPLHIRTAFAHVVSDLLPKGFHHTSASVLQPDTADSGDIYELFGSSTEDLKTIPLEFYTLEPHREHVFFADRDQLQACIEDPKALFKAFESSPGPLHHRTSVFVVKGDQLLNLKPHDWISRDPLMHEFPGVLNPEKQSLLVEKYLVQQPSYPFLKAIEDGLITSEGILLSRYFPSPMMKQLLLNDTIHRFLKEIYFEYPSLTFGEYFSHEDRSLLLDLSKFGIPCYWVDKASGKILQYVAKPGKDSGMFVPLEHVETFFKATLFGLYGSNLIEADFEQEMTELLKGIEKLKNEIHHPRLNPSTPIAFVTGGGPGSMSLGNRVAKNLRILSCANIMDFRGKKESILNEQKQNPYIDAKMTYRLDRLVERQAEFNLDFPIFLMGGIGTDFEYTLEEVRRKVGSMAPTPVLLFGPKEYWHQKITSRFQCNQMSGTISGSEWVSNCFYCITTAAQGLKIYENFFRGTLKIGPGGPIYADGFCLEAP
jgi:hypothetical protein